MRILHKGFTNMLVPGSMQVYNPIPMITRQRTTPPNVPNNDGHNTQLPMPDKKYINPKELHDNQKFSQKEADNFDKTISTLGKNKNQIQNKEKY